MNTTLGPQHTMNEMERARAGIDHRGRPLKRALSDDTIELTVFGTAWVVRFATLSDREWPACWCTEVVMEDGEPYLMEDLFHPQARVAFNDALEAALRKRQEEYQP